MYSEKEQAEILTNFAAELINNMVDVPPHIQSILDEHFWDLYQPLEDKLENADNSKDFIKRN